MSWFEEQLKFRKEQDNKSFSDSLSAIANAVMGKKLADSIDKEDLDKTALEKVTGYYHCKELMKRNVTLEKGWHKNAVGAMIGKLRENGKTVALIPGKFSGYSFLNPDTGKRERVNNKNEELFDTEATCYYRTLPQKSLTVKDLLIFSMQTLSTSDYILLVISSALVSVLGLLGPMFTKWLFGTVLESKNLKMLMALAFFMLCYTISRLLINAVKSVLNGVIGAKQNIAVEAAVIGRIMNLPANFFRNYSSGELTQRAAYTYSLNSTLFNTIGTVGLSSLFSLVYIGQIFSFAPGLVLPSLLIILSSAGISVASTLIQSKMRKQSMELSTKTRGLSYSTITGIQKIKLAGAEKRMFARWAKTYAKEAELYYNLPLFVRISSTLSLTVSLLGSLVLYIVAIKSGISVANYYAFTSSFALVSASFASVASLTSTFAEIKPCYEMAKPLLQATPEITADKHVIKDLKGSIELSNVSFRYSDDMPYIFDGLSLKIKAGEYVAIVGKTGCGKSTLLRLLLGFEKPNKGAIYYDNKDLNTLDVKALRQKIGTVMQDSKLFLGDIFSNIVISAPQLTLNEAWEAAEIASIADDIKAMPMGMQTYISEGQGGISGGQRQRLMIARAVASKPKILLFDEATSALDNITQKNVAQAIDKMKCTRVVIAHRLSTIRNADRIIYLEDGMIKEEGTYDDLIKLNGLFASLVERQRIDFES